MNSGIWNRILRVDLSESKVKIEHWSEKDWKIYLGGTGIGTKVLYEECNENTDPLGPENRLVFATGPFQGTNIPGSGKFVIVGKSPLTGTFAVSAAGANFAYRFKKTGFDALIIQGKALEPSFIWIDDQNVEIRKCSHIWGKNALESTNILKKQIGYGDRISIATIGKGGENRVGIGCIVVDEHSFGGRCGLGAVMGSKNLKAVIVHGTKKIKVNNIEVLDNLAKHYRLILREATRETLNAYGTSIFVESSEEVGDLPIKYWVGDTWREGALKIGATRYIDYLRAKPWPCHACPVGCHRKINLEGQKYNITGAGPEYESIAMLGSCCLIDDLESISMANLLCNSYGLDTISAGAYVAFTMECFEKGIITTTDLGGMSANWGDGEFLIEMIKQIGEKKGFGALFDKGIRAAAEKIGGEAPSLIVEVKNLDFPAHDPRSYFSLGINYATSTRGACHLRGYPHMGELEMIIPEADINESTVRFNMLGKPLLAKTFQDYSTINDALVICIYMPINGMDVTGLLGMLNAITGWDMDAKELFRIGERVWNMQRLINITDGYTNEDDRLPSKIFLSAKEGFRKNKIFDVELFDKALIEYYQIRGWDIKGNPTKEKLRELDII